MNFFSLSTLIMSFAFLSACGDGNDRPPASPESVSVASISSISSSSALVASVAASSLMVPEQHSSSAPMASSSLAASHSSLVAAISSASAANLSPVVSASSSDIAAASIAAASSINSQSSIAAVASSLDSRSSIAAVSSSLTNRSSIAALASSFSSSSMSAVASSNLSTSSTLALASSSNNSSSTISQAFSSSSAVLGDVGAIYYVRGTFNGWADEDKNYVLTPVANSNFYRICIHFTETGDGNYFKIDPNGGWGGDELPLEHNYKVAPGWVNISFNIADQVVNLQQNLAENCAASASSSAVAFSSSISSASSSGLIASSAASISLVSSSSAFSSSSLSPPNTNSVADVKTAAGTLDSRLACYKGSGEKACNLRTYQVMVEAFVNGDDSINMSTGYGTSHHKGDLQGVINSLDYIASLGVNTLWLTPVFDSSGGAWPSQMDATGYFASNYFNVDKYFGSKDKLKELIDKAHEKGLYVLLDGVFGHAKSGAANYSTASPGGRKLSGNSNPLPYPDNLEFFKEVASYWVTHYKIDGWRLDQAYQVPVQYWSEIRSAVEVASKAVTYTNSAGDSVHPLGYMVGEIWKDEANIAASGYGAAGSPGLLSAFDFPMRYRLVQTLAMQEEGSYVKHPANYLQGGYDTQKVYPEHAMPNLMLTNHDLVRFGDLLQRAGIAGPNDEQYWARHKAAFSFLAAYSGPITLYYGDEIGQEVANFAARNHSNCSDAGNCDDHVSRDSGVVQGISGRLNSQQSDLKNYVAGLMNLREAHPALWNGSRTHIYGGGSVYMDRKDKGDDHILYALNTTNAEVRISLEATAIGASGDLVDLLDARVFTNQAGVYYLILAPFQAAFLTITK